LLAKKEITWLYITSFLFIITELFFIYKEYYLAFFVPLVLLFLFLAFYSLDKFYLAVVFFTPLSVPLQYFLPKLGFNLAIPTEPFLILILFLLLYRFLRRRTIDKYLLLHPLTLAILIYLSWILITAITSTMPWVSLKFFISHLWFIAGAYFLAYEVFREEKNIPRFLWFYIIPLTLIIFFTTYHQAQAGLINQKAAHSAMHPSYNDHTAYGAILALFLPVLTGMVFLKFPHRKTGRFWIFLLIVLFVFALIFSYSRAAWISLAGAIVLFILVHLHIRIETITLFSAILIGLFFSYQTNVWIKLEKNKQQSSTSFAKHIESITNVRSDASNMERINRWKCALRMFREKPLTGWGPGTYMFQYAPFQISTDRTIISTDFGDMGNAHSEYLGPMAETGLPGLLSVLAFVFIALYTGIRVYFRAREKWVKTLALSIFTGLSTYFVHGLLNNFLDTDKAAVPFWGFLAILVFLDIRYVKNKHVNTVGE